MKSYLLVAAVVALASALGCAPRAEALCDEKCDCEGCNDAQWDDCVHAYDSTETDADHSDCLDDYDDWLSCQEDTYWCDKHEWKDDCKNERDRLRGCTH